MRTLPLDTLVSRAPARRWSARNAPALLAGLLLLALVPAAEAQKPQPEKSGRTATETGLRTPSSAPRAKSTGPTRVAVTGSLLDRPVGPGGGIPVTPSAVSVLTANDIQRMGASSIAQALRRGIPGSR